MLHSQNQLDQRGVRDQRLFSLFIFNIRCYSIVINKQIYADKLVFENFIRVNLLICVQLRWSYMSFKFASLVSFHILKLSEAPEYS